MVKSSLQANPQNRLSAPDYVIMQIKQALIENRLQAGDRLPSEPELQELYGVSRGSIRQAMKSLEMLGVVTIRPGDGTYVNSFITKNSFNSLAFALLLSRPSSLVMTEARYALERDIVELIMKDPQRTQTILPLLEENLRRHRELLSAHADSETLAANDLAFHHILSDNCGNPVLQIVYDYVMDAFQSELIATTSGQKSRNESMTLRDHSDILAALKTGDFSKVKQAIQVSMNNWGGMMLP